jgi:putative ABC transport system substrate-binding protein
MRLTGVLMGFSESDPAAQSLVAVFRGALAKLSWMEGSNLRIELRWGNGNAARIGTFAKELVDLRPDAILGETTSVIRALVRETRTIPIVFVQVSDPTASGFTTSLARPSGNITGFTVENAPQGGKWVQLLKEIAPSTAHVALLFNPATGPPLQFFMPSIQAAASSLSIQPSVASVEAKDEIEVVFATQARDPGGGLIVLPAPFNAANGDLIIALAARYGINLKTAKALGLDVPVHLQQIADVPVIYFNRFFAESGGLISYGTDFAEQFREGAGYIDRIRAKPADLPVQAPTKFELIIGDRIGCFFAAVHESGNGPKQTS